MFAVSFAGAVHAYNVSNGAPLAVATGVPVSGALYLAAGASTNTSAGIAIVADETQKLVAGVDIGSGTTLWTEPGWVSAVTISPDGSRFAILNENINDTVAVYDIHTGATTNNVTFPDDAVVMNLDGQLVGTVGYRVMLLGLLDGWRRSRPSLPRPLHSIPRRRLHSSSRRILDTFGQLIIAHHAGFLLLSCSGVVSPPGRHPRYALLCRSADQRPGQPELVRRRVHFVEHACLRLRLVSQRIHPLTAPICTPPAIAAIAAWVIDDSTFAPAMVGVLDLSSSPVHHVDPDGFVEYPIVSGDFVVDATGVRMYFPFLPIGYNWTQVSHDDSIDYTPVEFPTASLDTATGNVTSTTPSLMNGATFSQMAFGPADGQLLVWNSTHIISYVA